MCSRDPGAAFLRLLEHVRDLHRGERHVDFLRFKLGHLDRLTYQAVQAIGLFIDDRQ